MDFSPCATSANVRIAARGDAEAMRAVYAPYVETPVTFDTVAPSRAEFAARMADAMVDYPCLVLEQDGRVIGFAYAHAQASRAAYRWNAELSVYLEQGATGGGRGRTLYDALLKLLRAQGVKSAYGLVTVPNEASERLHAGCGFSVAGAIARRLEGGFVARRDLVRERARPLRRRPGGSRSVQRTGSHAPRLRAAGA